VSGARRGEWATLIGDDLTLDEVAKFCGSIAYELLTRMGRRHHRIYRTE
jgi:alanine racemase